MYDFKQKVYSDDITKEIMNMKQVRIFMAMKLIKDEQED